MRLLVEPETCSGYKREPGQECYKVVKSINPHTAGEKIIMIDLPALVNISRHYSAGGQHQEERGKKLKILMHYKLILYLIKI